MEGNHAAAPMPECAGDTFFLRQFFLIAQADLELTVHFFRAQSAEITGVRHHIQPDNVFWSSDTYLFVRSQILSESTVGETVKCY